MKNVSLEQVIKLVETHQERLRISANEVSEVSGLTDEIAHRQLKEYFQGRIGAYRNAMFLFEELLADLNELN